MSDDRNWDQIYIGGQWVEPAGSGVNKYGRDFVGPFGGYKATGIGREYGIEGLRAFTEVRNIAP